MGRKISTGGGPLWYNCRLNVLEKHIKVHLLQKSLDKKSLNLIKLWMMELGRMFFCRIVQMSIYFDFSRTVIIYRDRVLSKSRPFPPLFKNSIFLRYFYKYSKLKSSASKKHSKESWFNYILFGMCSLSVQWRMTRM